MGVLTTFTLKGEDMLGYLQLETLSVDYQLNGRPTCRFMLRAVEPDKVSPLLSTDTVHGLEVYAEIDSVPAFGGVVWNVDETTVIDYRHHEYPLQASGYAVYGDVTLFNGIIVSGTVKSMLTTIVGNIGHGISVDGSQANGPTLVAQGFPFLTCNGCLDQVSTASTWFVKWNFDKTLRMYDPGSVGAPFALTDTNGTLLKLTSSRTLNGYANDVWVQFGSSTQQQVTDTFVGDGSTQQFILRYNVAITPATLTVNGVTFPVGIYGVDSLEWTYDVATNSMRHTGTALTGSDTLSITFTAQFPGAINKHDDTEISLYGTFSVVLSYPDVFDAVQAGALADGELARRNGVPRTIKATTYTAGLEPGMTVNVTATKYDISGVDFLITQVSLRHVVKMGRGVTGNNIFFYDITAIEDNRYQANWQQYFKNLLSGGSSSGATSVAGSGAVSAGSVVSNTFWGGSILTGQIANATWKDVPNAIPVRRDGSSGLSETVRVQQRTGASGTNVQARIVKRVGGVDTSMATSPTTTGTSATAPDDELITFTPAAGVNDYYLQVKGGNGSALVYAMGQSL